MMLMRYRTKSRRASDVSFCRATYHNMFVKLTHELDQVRFCMRAKGRQHIAMDFRQGRRFPGCQRNLPFSSKKPPNELQPGPPFSQIVMSLVGGPMVGWYTKNSALDESFVSIGIKPEYSSPTSKLISGKECTLYPVKYERTTREG